jgi:hypothetical protein
MIPTAMKQGFAGSCFRNNPDALRFPMTSTRSQNWIPSALVFLGALTTSAVLQAQMQSGGAAAKFQIHEIAISKGDRHILFIDDADVFLSSASYGCLQAISLSEGVVHQVVQRCSPGWTRNLSADDQNIVWLEAPDPSATPAPRHGDRLFSCLKDHCVPHLLGPKAHFLPDFPFVLHSGTLYASFASSASRETKLSGSTLVRIELESSHFGKMETITKTAAPIWALATDGTFLYYYAEDKERAIRRMPLHGNKRPELLIKHADDVDGLIAGDDINASLELGRMESLGQPRHWDFRNIVAADGESMYWSTGYLHSYRLRDKVVETVRDPEGKAVGMGGYIVLDRDCFYFTKYMEASSIQRVSKSGGTPETVVSNQGQVGALIVSKGRLFWSSYDPNHDETRFRWIALPEHP